MKERFKMAVAVHLFLISGNEVLLLRRYNTGYEDGNYSVVAGHIDPGEPYDRAMIREAEEEAGIRIRPEDLRAVQVMHRKFSDERIDYFFVAERWEGEIINKEPHKCDQLRWFPMDALPLKMVPYVRAALDNYSRGLAFTKFGWTAH